MKDICSKICTYIFRQVVGENCFSLPFEREKNCRFPSGGSEPRLREKLARCFNERGNFGTARSRLVYSAAWFIRTGAVCAWYIFIVKTVADNLEYVFSHGCSSLASARSYLTSIRPSVAYVARRMYATFCVMWLIMRICPSPTSPPTCSFAVTLIHRSR